MKEDIADIDANTMSDSMNACKIFLSYNSADAKAAERLGIELERFGFQVWFDKWEMMPGDSLTSTVSRAIDESNVFIFLLSPESVAAPWPQEELRAALNRRLYDKQFTVVPLLRKECSIPTFLRDYRWINGQSPRSFARMAEEVASLARKLGFIVPNIPKIVREARTFLGNFILLSTNLVIQFSEPRGERVCFTETHHVVASQAQCEITKRIWHKGEVTELSLEAGSLALKDSAPGTTTLVLTFHTREDKPFQYELKYCLNGDTFSKEDQTFYYYKFEAPTSHFSASLIFPKPVKDCRLMRQQGGFERLIEQLDPIERGGGVEYHAELADPPYLESVIFRWSWV